MQHAGLPCPVRTMCNSLARAKSSSWPSLFLSWPASKMAALFNMSPWHKMTSRPLAWVTRHQQTGPGVIPFKLLCAPTQYVQTHTQIHTLHEKQTKRLINYVYYWLSCCRSIKLCCSIWPAGSLIRALLLSAANCLCRFVYLHTARLYSSRGVSGAVVD